MIFKLKRKLLKSDSVRVKSAITSERGLANRKLFILVFLDVSHTHQSH